MQRFDFHTLLVVVLLTGTNSMENSWALSTKAVDMHTSQTHKSTPLYISNILVPICPQGTSKRKFAAALLLIPQNSKQPTSLSNE